MRAYVIRGPGVLEPSEQRDPVHGDNEVLLRTELVSICSTDASYFRGHLFPEAWPVIPGHRFSSA